MTEGKREHKAAGEELKAANAVTRNNGHIHKWVFCSR
jgi:hypothetical protein